MARLRDACASTRDDALGNFSRRVAVERTRDLDKIGKPVDRGEWAMTPPTVNAYYSPPSNNINFPAGILQPPFYDAQARRGGELRRAGAVIGHELTHGFDDQGAQFDAQGQPARLVDAGRRQGVRRARAPASPNQYSSYAVAGDAHINGKLTLGENIADNGGVRLALMAIWPAPARPPPQTLDGFTPEQRFFLGYAQVWCENARPRRERLQGGYQPAFVEQVPRERRRVEHAGVSEGVLVQGGRADGARERVPGLVRLYVCEPIRCGALHRACRSPRSSSARKARPGKHKARRHRASS